MAETRTVMVRLGRGRVPRRRGRAACVCGSCSPGVCAAVRFHVHSFRRSARVSCRPRACYARLRASNGLSMWRGERRVAGDGGWRRVAALNACCSRVEFGARSRAGVARSRTENHWWRSEGGPCVPAVLNRTSGRDPPRATSSGRRQWSGGVYGRDARRRRSGPALAPAAAERVWCRVIFGSRKPRA
jgi:hypothetical protein